MHEIQVSQVSYYGQLDDFSNIRRADVKSDRCTNRVAKELQRRRLFRLVMKGAVSGTKIRELPRPSLQEMNVNHRTGAPAWAHWGVAQFDDFVETRVLVERRHRVQEVIYVSVRLQDDATTFVLGRHLVWNAPAMPPSTEPVVAIRRLLHLNVESVLSHRLALGAKATKKRKIGKPWDPGYDAFLRETRCLKDVFRHACIHDFSLGWVLFNHIFKVVLHKKMLTKELLAPQKPCQLQCHTIATKVKPLGRCVVIVYGR